jgi:hypothetical protein
VSYPGFPKYYLVDAALSAVAVGAFHFLGCIALDGILHAGYPPSPHAVPRPFV